MKWFMFFSSFCLTNAMAYDYQCDYDILAKGSIISLDLKRSLILKEGKKSTDMKSHTIRQVFYQGENGPYFRYLILDEPNTQTAANSDPIIKNVVLGKFQITMRRESTDEAYFSIRLDDKTGSHPHEPDAIVSEEHYFEVDTGKPDENPIIRINCYYQ